LEILTQFIVAILLTIILLLTKGMELTNRVLIMLVGAMAASSSIIGQQLNWWALPPSYGIGVGFNLVLSWTIAYFISAKWIVK
jgi:hypothetical protein